MTNFYTISAGLKAGSSSALGSPVLLRRLLVGDAGEFAAQRALNLFRMSFAASHAAHVGTIHLELTRNSAVKTA